jgi:hypothetical protein
MIKSFKQVINPIPEEEDEKTIRNKQAVRVSKNLIFER